jgi:nucleotide-binding universal stress UspA family protein
MNPMNVKRILVPIDFSPSCEAALDTAIAFAKAAGSTIDLVHVYSLSTYDFPSMFTGYAEMMREVLEWIDERMSLLKKRVREAGVECSATRIEGMPVPELLRHAKKSGAELIVMSTHGRTGLPHVVLGSVAERLVQRAPCAVLVLHGEGAAESAPA